jgi:dTDP-glucose 4,6-dehydratase
MKRNILITGALGFLGFQFGKLLAENFPMYNIVGVDNERDKKYVHQKETLMAYPNYYYIKGDILNKQLIREIFLQNHTALSKLSDVHGIDIVYATAFESMLHDISIDGLEYYQNNILGALNIAMEYILTNHKNKRLVYISSVFVYGFRDDEHLIKEDAVPNPQSKNSFIKLSVEHLLKSLHLNFSLPITILRIPSIYGYGLKGDHLLMNIINAIIENRTISVNFSEKSIINCIFYEDLIIGFEKLITYESKGFDIFNMGGVNIYLRDFVQTVIDVFRDLTGEERSNNLIQFKNKLHKNCCISSEYAYKMLKWKNWTEVYWGLEKTIKAIINEKNHN